MTATTVLGADSAGSPISTMAASASGLTKVYGAGNTRVVALDQSAIGLRKAQQLATERGVRIGTVVANLDGMITEDIRHRVRRRLGSDPATTAREEDAEPLPNP